MYLKMYGDTLFLQFFLHFILFYFILFYLFMFKKFLMFIYFLGAGTEREEERVPSRLHTVSTETVAGLDFTTSEIMTRAEIKSWT